ncbi:MAG: hypothetical protein ACREM1_06250 [Longimicrobiales bacterium]
MRMTRISTALFIVAMALVAACGPTTAGSEPAPTLDPATNDTATDTLNVR